MDRSIKLFQYRSAGVREYWMIDHIKNAVTVYFFEEDFVEDYTLSDTIRAHIYDDLEIDFSQLDLCLLPLLFLTVSAVDAQTC